ncbi:MAG TPA: DUF6734 family protein [Acetobacteraceae bacterium]|jgi:hypothetical protein|nr:DUF6734 family protein [Acetobacteraceae bacterium]
MKAVWSFWSAPYVAHYRHTWARPLDHLLSWVLSVQTATRHYPDALLVTDSPGRALLVDRLGLPFTSVSTELDRFAGRDTSWWMLGKLFAYSLQTEAFVHIDSDVFLWKQLPAYLTAAPVLTQNPEYHQKAQYGIDEIDAMLRAGDGRLPAEWEWACSLDPVVRVENCGIVGGQDPGFLRHYALAALALIEGEPNQAALRSLPVGFWHNCAVEQFLLAACIGFHAGWPDSPHRGVRVAHLFPSWTEANDANYAARVGYTHLMGGKRIPAAGERLAVRVRRDWPDFYRRCERLADVLPA